MFAVLKGMSETYLTHLTGKSTKNHLYLDRDKENKLEVPASYGPASHTQKGAVLKQKGSAVRALPSAYCSDLGSHLAALSTLSC